MVYASVVFASAWDGISQQMVPHTRGTPQTKRPSQGADKGIYLPTPSEMSLWYVSEQGWAFGPTS